MIVMDTKIAQYVEFDVSELPVGHEPERKVYGFESTPRIVRPLAFEGRIGELEDRGKLFGDLLTKEEGREYATAGDMAALFNIYLLEKRGLFKPTGEQRQMLGRYFDEIVQGNTCDTVVDFDNGDRSKTAPEGYRRVLLINRPELLVVENGRIKEVKGGERKPKLWPVDGYVGRTCDGSYDEDGVPRKTWPTRPEAEQTWTDVQADKNFANAAVSYSWAREEGQGIAIVVRRFFNHDDGRFYLIASRNPDDWNDDVGRVPLSR